MTKLKLRYRSCHGQWAGQDESRRGGGSLYLGVVPVVWEADAPGVDCPEHGVVVIHEFDRLTWAELTRPKPLQSFSDVPDAFVRFLRQFSLIIFLVVGPVFWSLV